MAVAGAGVFLWSTPGAAAMLRAAFAEAPPADLPARLLAGQGAPEPVTVAGTDGRTALRFAHLGAAAPGETLFRLSLHDARPDEAVLQGRFPLTAREAEVLLWLARGKSNRDIAAILDLAPRTVNKHLETVFAKLGVENRASAAVLATRALGER